MLEKSKKNNNKDRLKYDVLVTPHHCSWGFFNDRPYAKNKTPKESAKELIGYGNSGSYVIANSKPIVNNEDNPPHHPARTEYMDAMNTSANFKCTGETPKESEPKPIEFGISNGTIHTSLSTVANATAYTAYKSQDRAHSYGSDHE